MDCKTARLLFDYSRPRSAELDPTETRALEDHLAGCEACDQLARSERRADEAVGKAMRAVDVPHQLQNRILDRMQVERGDRRRRWIAYSMCGAAAAAALILLGLGVGRWYTARPAFPAEQLLTDARNRVYGSATPDEVKAAFAAHGIEATPPEDFNYAYLRLMFLTTVEGRQTPLLIFNNAGKPEEGVPPQHALVFLVADSQFDLNALPVKPQVSVDNNYTYEYKCAAGVQINGDKRSGYVVYYTGDDWKKWLLRTPSPVESANGN
ncbi:MAG TPA: hypothetical protein VMS17_02440 [Gemmataceae bacterium]|nr:hypothetical protein [Gemmataceae bacterium]